ncbi:MAG: ABC transporter ATP-binding protein [Candidatus Bathyarchaeia archaeon]
MRALIQCKSLTKRFGKLTAVDQVTFEVDNGEVFGLLGPNGAGKTTTMRLLSTLLKPTGGTATIAGYDLLREPQKVRASIGVLPEDAGLYDRLTPKEHLLYYGRLHGMPKDSLSKRADELLDTMELTDRANTKVGDFSKGMKQKVALLRAFIHDPPVLLLDEPTAGLDVMSARHIHAFVERFRQEGKAIIISTHNMTEAQKLCNKIAIIDHARIVGMGTVEELQALTSQKDLESIFVQLVTE